MSNIGEKIVVGSPWLSEHIPCFSQSRNFRTWSARRWTVCPNPMLGPMENVVVVVEEKASRAVLADLDIDDENELLGLYHGISRDDESFFQTGGNMPSRISIYRKPILRICRTKQEVVQEVRDTVVHEIGHHFGLTTTRCRIELRGDVMGSIKRQVLEVVEHLPENVTWNEISNAIFLRRKIAESIAAADEGKMSFA